MHNLTCEICPREKYCCYEYKPCDCANFRKFKQKIATNKGLKGGSCNVTACQKPNAIYFNKSTKAYYCKSCADDINWVGGRKDTLELYGVPLLCELDKEDDINAN